MLKPLPREFYEPSARLVAPKLLGCWLVRQTARGMCGGPIVETEAYLADDPACHAYLGQTNRNRVMWGPPGFAYVYFIYGNHYCLNAVCRPAGIAEAVLIRAVEPAVGLELMREFRLVKSLHELTSGPGKLCAALGVDRTMDGLDLCHPESPLWIAENPDHAAFLRRAGPVVAARRVGITKAAELALRFYLQGSAFVSRKERAARAG